MYYYYDKFNTLNEAEKSRESFFRPSLLSLDVAQTSFLGLLLRLPCTSHAAYQLEGKEPFQAP